MNERTNNSEWRAVSGQAPCPVCGRGDWCAMTADGAVALCMRCADWAGQAPFGARDMPHGTGYLYHVEDNRAPMPAPPPAKPKHALAPVTVGETWGRYIAQNDRYALQNVSDALGYGPATLSRSGAVYVRKQGVLAWAMRDGRGNCVGIRFREAKPDGARKWALTGGGAGLFLPADPPAAGAVDAIVEGPTDMAALLEYGIPAIGRPSCSGGVDYVCEWIANRQYDRRVVIVADNDTPKRRPDGSQWYPGTAGATALAEAVFRRCGIRAAVVMPPHGHNDMRACLRAGVTSRAVRAVLRISKK